MRLFAYIACLLAILCGVALSQRPRQTAGSRGQVSRCQWEQAFLSAGSRQAGSRDRDDLCQPTPDPGRRTTQQ